MYKYIQELCKRDIKLPFASPETTGFVQSPQDRRNNSGDTSYNEVRTSKNKQTDYGEDAKQE